jgi:hypothetical protein
LARFREGLKTVARPRIDKGLPRHRRDMCPDAALVGRCPSVRVGHWRLMESLHVESVLAASRSGGAGSAADRIQFAIVAQRPGKYGHPESASSRPGSFGRIRARTISLALD